MCCDFLVSASVAGYRADFPGITAAARNTLQRETFVAPYLLVPRGSFWWEGFPSQRAWQFLRLCFNDLAYIHARVSRRNCPRRTFVTLSISPLLTYPILSFEKTRGEGGKRLGKGAHPVRHSLLCSSDLVGSQLGLWAAPSPCD